MTIPQAMALAVQHHQAGRLADAEALYRQILAVQPKHADALHLLGVVAHQAGRSDLAVEWIRQAIVLSPNPFAHSNLGEAYRATGRLDEAVAAYRSALALQPDYPEAHNNLGNALRDCRQLDEAIAAYRRALQLRPDYPEALNNLGMALAERGELDEAIAAYRRALELQPGHPEAHYNLGNALREQGEFDEAIAAYRRALRLQPDDPKVHNNLGNALAEQGELDEAMSAYRRALELQPDYPEAHNNLGNALQERGQLDAAGAAFHRALQLKPDYLQAHVNLGNALREQGQLDGAIAAYRRAVALKPDSPELHNNLGNALLERGQLGEALASVRRALELQPNLPEAHLNLGNALLERGQLDEALAVYRRALELQPDNPEAHNNMGNALRDRCQLDEAIAAYRRALQLKPGSPGFHSNLVFALHFHPRHDATTISEEHQSWNRRFSEPSRPFLRPHANDRHPDRRLRVGYVSPDFRDQVVGRNVLPLLQRHDRRHFEILCYSGVIRPDRLTKEFRRIAPQWRSTVGVGDEALADIIRRDAVDILVDLTQHMAGNRLPLFARQPAPVQVSFAGYPETTGLDAIEYRISDRYLESGSAEQRAGQKEQVCFIDSFWCYDPREVDVEVNRLPALESGGITFGCLNNFCKASVPVLKLWARVLRTVTDSRLILLTGLGSHRQQTLEVFAGEGVAAGRVEFMEYRRRREYLELYHLLDIALDSFPYNGHTTSLDALWMGVPVVSLAGETAVSRAGLSQLTNLGLPELVARSEAEYVNIAASLARNLPRLAELRSTLRHRMENSVLMDAPLFTRQIEQAFRQMWQAWCAGQSPIHQE